MEGKKLKKRCERIMDHVYPKLDDLELNGHSQNAVYEMIRDIQCVAFAFGYVVGQSVQLTYSEAQEDIEAIKKVIREQGLLRYLSRERKAASSTKTAQKHARHDKNHA